MNKVQERSRKTFQECLTNKPKEKLQGIELNWE